MLSSFSSIWNKITTNLGFVLCFLTRYWQIFPNFEMKFAKNECTIIQRGVCWWKLNSFGKAQGQNKRMCSLFIIIFTFLLIPHCSYIIKELDDLTLLIFKCFHVFYPFLSCWGENPPNPSQWLSLSLNLRNQPPLESGATEKWWTRSLMTVCWSWQLKICVLVSMLKSMKGLWHWMCLCQWYRNLRLLAKKPMFKPRLFHEMQYTVGTEKQINLRAINAEENIKTCAIIWKRLTAKIGDKSMKEW